MTSAQPGLAGVRNTEEVSVPVRQLRRSTRLLAAIPATKMTAQVVHRDVECRIQTVLLCRFGISRPRASIARLHRRRHMASARSTPLYGVAASSQHGLTGAGDP